MSYELAYERRALELLADDRFSDVLDCIEGFLLRLAADPVGRSAPSDSSTAPTGQMFRFHCESQEAKFQFTVYFFYRQDEQTLQIEDIIPARTR